MVLPSKMITRHAGRNIRTDSSSPPSQRAKKVLEMTNSLSLRNRSLPARAFFGTLPLGSAWFSERNVRAITRHAGRNIRTDSSSPPSQRAKKVLEMRIHHRFHIQSNRIASRSEIAPFRRGLSLAPFLWGLPGFRNVPCRS
jgi:hypothetical protein